jgi:hypothetical protein
MQKIFLYYKEFLKKDSPTLKQQTCWPYSILQILINNISETGIWLCSQVRPTLLGPSDRASPHLHISVSKK